MTPLEVVLAELDRIEQLDTVQHDDGRADTFAVGARWTCRMLREAIERGAPAPSVGEDPGSTPCTGPKEPDPMHDIDTRRRPSRPSAR